MSTVIVLTIRNPFSERWDIIKEVTKMAPNHRSIEFNLYRTNVIFNFTFQYRTSRCDHRGYTISFGLFGYEFDYDNYDTRHKEDYNE